VRAEVAASASAEASMRASGCPARTACPWSAYTASTWPVSWARTCASRSAIRLPESCGPVRISCVCTTAIASGPSVTPSAGFSTAASLSFPHAATTRAAAAAIAARPITFVFIIPPFR
jgi:hypothetical protein